MRIVNNMAFGKSCLIGVRAIRKRDWLLVLLCDLHLHLKAVGQLTPPCKCNFQRNPSLFAFTWKTSLFAFIWKISLFAFIWKISLFACIWKTVRALLWLKCRAGQANPSRDCVVTANLAPGLQDLNPASLFKGARLLAGGPLRPSAAQAARYTQKYCSSRKGEIYLRKQSKAKKSKSFTKKLKKYHP